MNEHQALPGDVREGLVSSVGQRFCRWAMRAGPWLLCQPGMALGAGLAWVSGL